MHVRSVIIPLFVAVAAVVPASGDPPAPPALLTPPKGYVAHKATKAPVIDGKLDDPAWAVAAWSDDFVDIEGDLRPKPRHRTRMKMTWDDDALYIAAELTEPHIWATLTEHDAVIFHDPDFEVFLDPDGDNHLYAELELNAKNTTWDLLLTKPYKDGGRALNGWEIIGLKTAVRINGTMNDPTDTDSGWTVEIRWPWTGLKEIQPGKDTVPPLDGDQWRINFSRVEWDFNIVGGKYVKVAGKKEHNWVWSPQGAIDMHRPERWGYVQFSNGEPGKVPFRPDPALAARNAVHRIYYAQRAYWEQHGKYATSAEQLGLKDAALLEVTTNHFEASVPTAGGKRVYISPDSRVWMK